MKTKNLSVGIAGIFLFVAAGLPQSAVAEEVEMDLRFAGAFVTGITHVVDPETGATAPSALIHTTSKGSPGRAVTRGFGGVTMPAGAPISDCLGIPFGLPIAVIENPLVFTFQDLSLLYAKGGSGLICIDLGTGAQKFVIDIVFDGGTGRFEGATGGAAIIGEGVPLNSARTFLAETGTIVGTIFVPDDDDDSDSDSDSDDDSDSDSDSDSDDD